MCIHVYIHIHIYSGKLSFNKQISWIQKILQKQGMKLDSCIILLVCRSASG